MKKRKIATVLFCSALGGLLWFWTMRSSLTELTRHPDRTSAHITLASASAAPATIETPRTSDRADPLKIFEAIEATNVPINFWGKVVDQDARLLVGVKIKYDYTIEHGNLLGVAWSDQEVRTGETATDKDGLFSVEGLKGHDLSIVAMRHADYQFRGKGALGFDFYGSTASGKFVSNRHKPVVFTMVHKQRLEPLVHSEGTLHVRGDGTPERWSLWKGEADPNGELLLTLRRDPPVLQRPGQAATWSADLQIVGGGIIEAPWDEDVRRAPDAGYVDSLPYPDREQKQGVPYRSFYAKTADGRFGRIQIELDARGEGATAPCYISGDMNPSPGSRNLEPTDEE